MKRSILKVLIVLMVLALVGMLRMPFEQKLTKELEEEHFIAPSFNLEDRASLSQKGFVASFGSLRPGLAALYALTSSGLHGRSDWAGLEDTFETVVLLDPYNAYYWDLGAWHLAYNAASSTRENMEIPPLKRLQLAAEYREKGGQFYDRGIRANPMSLSLRREKARLWSHPTRDPDYQKVAEVLEGALADLELNVVQRERLERELFYALLRTPERVEDAYHLGRRLFGNPKNRVPSLVNGLCVLQMHPRVRVETPLTLTQLYGDRETARRLLENYFTIEDDAKPMFGVKDLLDSL